MASHDEEELTADLFRRLQADAQDPDSACLDSAIFASLRDFLAMPHNATVGPRIVGLFGSSHGADSGATAACVAAALHGVPQAPALGPIGRAELMSALEEVGIGARAAPFPASPGTPCEDLNSAVVLSATGDRLNTHRGEPFWRILSPLAGSPGQRCYAIVRRLRECLGGEVVHALAATEAPASSTGDRAFQLDASGAAWAVKCLDKNRPPTDEDPFKEVSSKIIMGSVRPYANSVDNTHASLVPL